MADGDPRESYGSSDYYSGEDNGWNPADQFTPENDESPAFGFDNVATSGRPASRTDGRMVDIIHLDAGDKFAFQEDDEIFTISKVIRKEWAGPLAVYVIGDGMPFVFDKDNAKVWAPYI